MNRETPVFRQVTSFCPCQFQLYRPTLVINCMATHITEDQEFDFLPKGRDSSYTCDSEAPSDEPLSLQNWLRQALPFQLRDALFAQAQGVSPLSAKMTQRSVSWLMSLSWSRSLSEESLWLTVLYFHALQARVGIRKEDLQLTLISCLSLALKVTSHKTVYTLAEVGKWASRQLQSDEILEKQGKVLQALQFNLIIPNYLSEIAHYQRTTEQRMTQVKFITELMMVKDCKIFFDAKKLADLVSLLEGELEEEEAEGLRKEIKGLLGCKECQIVQTKYASKMDLTKFKALF